MAVILNIISQFDDRGVKRAQARLAQFGSSAKGFAGSTSADLIRAGAALDNVGKRAQAAGRTMSIGVTAPLAALGYMAWQAGSEFDLSMRQVKAAAGATANDMKQLTAMAESWGYKSVFSAQAVSAAMLALVKSGITPAQVKAGALKATMQLAAAGELELGAAAESVANTLGMFGLRAKEAGTVADALAGGANASSASVDSLRQALAQVGPGARNAGLNLQETTAVLAAFANKGIQGSDAGTSLKTMLTRLVPQTDKQAKAMKALDLSFVDSKGRIDDISTVAEKLKDKLGGLSQAERSKALTTIFGSDATRAATVLMQEGERGIRSYVKATSDRQAAEKMAAAQTASDSGQTKQAMASIKTAAIDLQKALAPMVRDVARGIGSVAKAFGSMPAPAQKSVVAFAAAAAAIGPLLYVFGSFTRVAGGVVGAAGKIGLAFGKNAEAAPTYARAIAGASKGMAALTKTIAQGVVALGRQAVAFTVAAAKTVAHTAATIASRAAALAAAAASKVWAAGQWLLNAALTANPIGLVVVAIGALVAAFIIAWKHSETFRKIVTGAWNAIKRATKAVFDWIVGFFRKWGPLVLRVLIGPIGNLVVEIVRHWNAIKTGAVSAFNAVVSFARSVPGRIRGAVGNLGQTLYNAGADLLRGLWNGMQSIAGWLRDRVLNFFSNLLPGWAKKALGIGSPSRVFAAIGKQAAAGMALGLDQGRKTVAEAAARLSGSGIGNGELAVSLAASRGANAPLRERAIRETVAAGKAGDTYVYDLRGSLFAQDFDTVIAAANRRGVAKVTRRRVFREGAFS